MTLAELRYLVAVAQERHFGRAARQCCVSQPALSTAIKKLEQELGVALFVRERANISVTPVGEEIVAQARRVLDSAAAIHAIADSAGNHLASPLAVGTLCTLGPYLLPQCVAQLQASPDNLELNMQQAPLATLRQKLRAGELDALVVALPFSEPDVVTQPLYEEPLVVLLPRSHPLAGRTELRPQDLIQQPLLMLTEEHCLHHQIRAALPGGDIAYRTGQNLETLRNMVTHGLGITVVPLCAATSLCAGSTLLTTRPFAQPVPKRQLALAWRASFPRHKAVDRLREALLASANNDWHYYDDDISRRGLLVDNSHW